MTYKEDFMTDHNGFDPTKYGFCPITRGYNVRCINMDNTCSMDTCRECWDQEIPGTAISDGLMEGIVEDLRNPVIKDSGERTEFGPGLGCRDMHAGKGDMASVPWEAILRLSVHYENGAAKYERWNFRKGIPVSSFIDSACRHLAKYQCGCDDEDHLAAAAFNVLGAMLMENTKPEMQDLPLRQGKNTFDYFKTNESNTN